MNIYALFHIVPGDTCPFIKLQDKNKGQATNCAHIGGSTRIRSLSKCKETAKAANANAFNWKNGMCYYKKCADLSNQKLETKHGGFDIYITQCGKGEEMNIF